MKTNSTNKPERFDYVPVKNLEKGQTIINLGIIENVFPNESFGLTKIVFRPARAISTLKGMYTMIKTEDIKVSLYFQPSDKLMCA